MDKAVPIAEDGRVFPVTRWSLIARAASPDSPEVRHALDAILRRYIPALRVHLTVGRHLPNYSADDLLQGFISDRVLERNLIALADRSRGKFRTFLLASLDRYCIDQYRAQRAMKRSPVEKTQGLDGQAFAVAGPDEQLAREAAFDVEWARQLLNQAVNAMRAECNTSDKAAMWILFEERILRPAFDGKPPADYETLVQRLGLASPAKAANLLVTSKRMLVRHLRAAIGEYALDSDVDQELNDLRQVLSGQGP